LKSAPAKTVNSTNPAKIYSYIRIIVYLVKFGIGNKKPCTRQGSFW
jgi:hypothetical protein